jgi:NAD(P)-dependent dehydrogenase (short-subunit alcohol dehydrogenase family)
VNDLGVERDGTAAGSAPAQEVVAEIKAQGGEAIANGADVADWDQVGAMVRQAIDTFGRLDTVVCNAVFLRDRMLANMSVDEWDAIMRVHLRGHFVPARHAIAHWRDLAKAGEKVEGASSTPSSGRGSWARSARQLRRGQGRYRGADRAAGRRVGRYGVLANAIAPMRARA